LRPSFRTTQRGHFNEAFLDGASHMIRQAWSEQNYPVPLCLELHSSSEFFHERFVAIDSTVNFEPLPSA
jgi:hypothetical protein